MQRKAGRAAVLSRVQFLLVLEGSWVTHAAVPGGAWTASCAVQANAPTQREQVCMKRTRWAPGVNDCCPVMAGDIITVVKKVLQPASDGAVVACAHGTSPQCSCENRPAV